MKGQKTRSYSNQLSGMVHKVLTDSYIAKWATSKPAFLRYGKIVEFGQEQDVDSDLSIAVVKWWKAELKLLFWLRHYCTIKLRWDCRQKCPIHFAVTSDRYYPRYFLTDDISEAQLRKAIEAVAYGEDDETRDVSIPYRFSIRDMLSYDKQDEAGHRTKAKS